MYGGYGFKAALVLCVGYGRDAVRMALLWWWFQGDVVGKGRIG
jgi:hypothetical protein